MALYDQHIKNLKKEGNFSAADIIAHLQEVVRQYNSDDAIFDDEKKTIPMEEHIKNLHDIIPFMPVIALSNDEDWLTPISSTFLDRVKTIPIRQMEKPPEVGKGMIFSWEKGTML